MGFTDDLKRSLGFEDVESPKKEDNGKSGIESFIDSFRRPVNQDNNSQQQRPAHNQQYYRQNRQHPSQHYSSSNYYGSDEVIYPEQSFYEIILLRPKTIDDINYMVDQVIEEKNPVILDLSFLERESMANFKLAGDKIKQMKLRYGVQALLLEHNEDKNLIIVSPKKVSVTNKG